MDYSSLHSLNRVTLIRFEPKERVVKLSLPSRNHVHKWKIISIGSDMSRYFSEDLEPAPAAAAGDLAIGRGCIMRVCEKCGKREIVRNVVFEDGPAAKED